SWTPWHAGSAHNGEGRNQQDPRAAASGHRPRPAHPGRRDPPADRPLGGHPATALRATLTDGAPPATDSSAPAFPPAAPLRPRLALRRCAPPPLAPGAAVAVPAADDTPLPGTGAEDPRFYRGRVTARGGLALRTSPERGSKVIRVVPRGEEVWIHCKTDGENVDGNHLWYLLVDGAWAWGSARYIDNIGPAPRWC
ncbi:SH3 domain-containing protein, partial [Streptomyces mexicanus]|uniref:SH3 domain-containing protein n=1 Tax=Streptomyces mexicanus TaxID=178566 RepID=UPI002E29315C